MRLEIPLNKMRFCTGLSYRQMPENITDHFRTAVAVVQINGETRGDDPVFYGKVAYSFMIDT